MPEPSSSKRVTLAKQKRSIRKFVFAQNGNFKYADNRRKDSSQIVRQSTRRTLKKPFAPIRKRSI